MGAAIRRPRDAPPDRPLRPRQRGHRLIAGYTVVSLRDVEDSGAPGDRMPFGHRHSEQEEIYVVLSGSARFKLEDAVEELGPLDALRVPGSTARGIEAGPDGAELIAFGAPFTGNKDAEPVPGLWED